MGDVVDTDLAMDGSTTNVLRAQMPRFGRQTRAQFTLPSTTQQITLHFAHGLWGLPSLSMVNSHEQILKTVVVTFVFDKTGNIHSVRCQPMYLEDSSNESTKGDFKVKYKWVEESAVSVVAGQAIMYLMVFLASVFYLIVACGVFVSEDDDDEGIGEASGGGGVPKWD